MPVVTDEIVWETEMKGAPGKLTFKVLPDKELEIEEGDAIRYKRKDKGIFYGFIFAISRDGETYSITAYDQIRYLKNKDTYGYRNLRADQVIRLVAGDFRLQVGDLESTGYIIKRRLEDNKSLMDIIQTALDLTLQNTTRMFILYDDFGKLCLKNIDNMRLNILVGGQTAEKYNYKTSLEGSYNKVKLSRENKETGKRHVYISQDSAKMNQWGILQHYDKLDDNENGGAKADALLKLYNKKNETLNISNVLGDDRVRAGSGVYVYLKDIGKEQYMLVEKVKHRFTNDEHTMDLTLRW